MFLLVPAYPGCPGSKAVKRSLLLLLSGPRTVYETRVTLAPPGDYDGMICAAAAATVRAVATITTADC